MKTPAIIIYAIETMHMKLGKEYFVHSKKEHSYYVPLANVHFQGDTAIWVTFDGKKQMFLLNDEIKEVQFIQG